MGSQPTRQAGTNSSSKPGFFAGVGALWGGIASVVSTPSMWALSLVPMSLALLLTGILGALSIKLVPTLVANSVGSTDAWWSFSLQAMATLAALVVSFLLALGLAQPLSGPALDALVRRVEKRLGAKSHPESSVVISMLRSLASALLGLGFGLPFLALAFLLNFVPGGSFVAVPLKFLIAMIALGWDLCDYPLSARGAPIGARVRFITENIWAVVGFSFGVALVALLPCGALLILPAGVCGAARLVHDIEEHQRKSRL